MQNQIEKEEKKGSRTISEREGGRPGRGGGNYSKTTWNEGDKRVRLQLKHDFRRKEGLWGGVVGFSQTIGKG